jgi:hypothetical protein
VNQLVGEIAEFIQERVKGTARTLPDIEGTLRSNFHGPPLHLLEKVLVHLVTEGGLGVTLGDGTPVQVPVLLPVERLESGTNNPPVGISGLCDQSHLLALRNTPSCPRFLALVAPAQHSILSVAQATDDFGLAPGNNSGSASTEEWWADDFIQHLVDRALSRSDLLDSDRDGARHLLKEAVLAAEEGDRHDPRRPHGWAAISRVLSMSHTSVPFLTQWSLACGFPPASGGRIEAKEQARVLQALMSSIVDEGYASSAERLKRNATGEEQDAIEACLRHLRRECEVPLALTRAGAFYYAPTRGTEIESAPDWWGILTSERLAELLEQEADEQVGELAIQCTNAVIAQGRGLPCVVADEVALSVVAPDGSSITASLVRDGGGQGNRREWHLPVTGQFTLEDDATPKHRQALRFTASAPGMKKATLRVVSLAEWEPGIVVTSRTATKVKLPKKTRSGSKHTLECDMVLAGEGRHLIELYVSPGVILPDRVAGVDLSTTRAESLSGTVSLASHASGASSLELEATADCHYDLDFTRADGSNERLRIIITSDEVASEGCRSEFERLIRLNRLARAVDIQVDHQVRAADLQGWVLAAPFASRSFYPLVLASDCRERWRAPTWNTVEDTILSRGRFLHDPRPSPSEIAPPQEFLEARASIFARIRGEEGHGLVEVAELGKWMQEPDFAASIDAYVRAYLRWLEQEPEVAVWADLVLVCGVEADGRTLAQEPDAVLVSPLHPVRIGWHCLAQRALREAWKSGLPCPASSILDPDSVPDTIVVPLRTPSGTNRPVVFLSTECSSDYWSVLWNGNRIDRLPTRADSPPFDEELGIRLGGLSSGFSVSQVHRALDDVAALMSAKPVLNVAIANHGGHSDACNDGLMSWAFDRFAGKEGAPVPASGFGTRQLQVFDERRAEAQPQDAAVANLTEDTAGAVKWFTRIPTGAKPDLGIIAQLEASNATVDKGSLGSPLGIGALMRHRVRTQLAAGGGAFLAESRTGVEGPPSGDGLADAVMRAAARLENLGESRTGYTFAPSVQAIHSMFKLRAAEYVAVSSSAVDPACFLGGWLDGVYLWDYELPSYSHRAGDTNGYYLLSEVKTLEREALQRLLAKLPGCESLDEQLVEGILLEVARRGIPTIRGLSAGHTGATGDLGLFLAGRLLQDEFRGSADGPHSLLRVHAIESEAHEVSLVIPVDPFRGYLLDLQRSLGVGEFQRPDLLVASIVITDSEVRCRITPVEVKYRREETMTPAASREALSQASALARLLVKLEQQGTENGLLIWKLTFQHLLLSMLDFGFRVYSQHLAVSKNPAEWSTLHHRVIAAVLADEANVEIDAIGRLIVFDASASSAPRDSDNDEFRETVVISAKDAARMIAGDPSPFYAAIRNAIHTWRFRPVLGGPELVTHSKDLSTGSVNSPGGDIEDPDPTKNADVPVSVPQRTVPNVTSPAVDGGEGGTPGGTEADTTGENELSRQEPLSGDGIRVLVGNSMGGFTPTPMFLRPNLTALNQLNMGVVGDLGTGKTQLVKSLVYQITRAAASNGGVKPRFLIFDYKRDYSADDFVRAVGARVVTPYDLPLNLFDVSGAGVGAAPWLARFKFFADVLDKIYSNVGPVQRENLKQAVRDAYQDAGAMGRQPTIYDVYDRYKAHVQGKPDAPLSIIGDMIDMELFARDPAKTADFDSFLDGVVVLSLDALGQDDRTKNMLVAIMLNMFYEHMLRIPKRPYRGTDPQLRTIDSYLLVDEADNIMRYEFDVLRKVLLQGREFGVGVILASQYLRHFKAGATDYREPLLSWFIHKVPNVTVQELAALGLPAGTAQTLVDRIRQLGNHECLFKTFDVAGEVVAGKPFYSLVADENSRRE